MTQSITNGSPVLKRWSATAGAFMLGGLLATTAFGQEVAASGETRNDTQAPQGMMHHGQQGAAAPGRMHHDTSAQGMHGMMQKGREHKKASAEGEAATAPCPGMKATRQSMMGDVAQTNAKLEDLLEKMDAAKGDAKLAAMSAVIHELVAERRQFARMMGNKKKTHMMGHMQGMGQMHDPSEGSQGAKSSHSMMKGTTGMGMGAPATGESAESPSAESESQE